MAEGKNLKSNILPLLRPHLKSACRAEPGPADTASPPFSRLMPANPAASPADEIQKGNT